MEYLSGIKHLVSKNDKMDFSNEMLYVDLYKICNSVYNIRLHENKLQHYILIIDVRFKILDCISCVVQYRNNHSQGGIYWGIIYEAEVV